VFPLGQRLGGFGKQPGRDLATDSGKGLHNRHIGGPPGLTRFLCQGRQESLDVPSTPATLLGQHAQTRQQEPTMGLSRFRHPRGQRAEVHAHSFLLTLLLPLTSHDPRARMVSR
jgi:hypothetical protein